MNEGLIDTTGVGVLGRAQGPSQAAAVFWAAKLFDLPPVEGKRGRFSLLSLLRRKEEMDNAALQEAACLSFVRDLTKEVDRQLKESSDAPICFLSEELIRTIWSNAVREMGPNISWPTTLSGIQTLVTTRRVSVDSFANRGWFDSVWDKTSPDVTSPSDSVLVATP